MLTVTGCIKKSPPQNYRGDEDIPMDEITATSEDYLDAVATLDQQVPEGWRMLCTAVTERDDLADDIEKADSSPAS